MRNSILFLSIILTSCTTYQYQLVSNHCSNCLFAANFTTGGNDSVEIEYNLYAQNGVMGFKINNKMNRPIYIDWKRSGFIINGQRYQYWSDETNILAISSGVSTLYRIGNLPPIAKSEGLTQATSSKPERVTFLIGNSSYTPSNVFKLILNDRKIEMSSPVDTFMASPQSSSSYDTYTVKQQYYESGQSPLIFRNYITYSFDETFASYKTIDNSFYTDKIQLSEKSFLINNAVKNRPMKFFIKSPKENQEIELQ
jgi:hypothetical protein